LSEVRFEQTRGEARLPHRINGNRPYLVGLCERRQLLADDVVLACGDPRPEDLPLSSGNAQHPSYISDPHQPSALGADCSRMLLIGTALTMADVAIAAAAQNPRVELH